MMLFTKRNKISTLRQHHFDLGLFLLIFIGFRTIFGKMKFGLKNVTQIKMMFIGNQNDAPYSHLVYIIRL